MVMLSRKLFMNNLSQEWTMVTLSDAQPPSVCGTDGYVRAIMFVIISRKSYNLNAICNAFRETSTLNLADIGSPLVIKQSDLTFVIFP